VEKVSHPLSPRYGRFLSYADVKSITSNPSALSFLQKSLSSWNEETTVASISNDEMWVIVEASVGTIEKRFLTKCYQCQCAERRFCEPPTLPIDWTPHVDLIVGLSDAIYIEESNSREGAIQACSSWPRGPYLPMGAIQKLYNVDTSKSTISNRSTTGAVFEVNAPYEMYNPSDLAEYQRLSGLKGVPVTQFAGSSKVTFGCDNDACAEPMTDVEMMLGMAPGLNFTYITTSVNPVPPSGNSILQYLMDLSSQENPPYIHSISWGPPESHLSADIANRMNQEFAKLSARGLTFVTSSGDDGVNYRAARTNPSACGLSPQYPAGSPYVTTVGGTMGPEYGASERAAQTNVPTIKATITTGGGFSVLYAQPSYQSDAVKAYLATPGIKLPPSLAFTATNRAYPDVSLVANNINSVIDGACVPTGGTSSSAPLFAGMLALILDARFQRGLPPLGLVNPALYHLAEVAPEVFNDITVGDNHCTGKKSGQFTCCPLGFQCVPGWDPVTGLGSVNFEQLKSRFLELPLKP